MNSEIAALNIITIDDKMECSAEDVVEVLNDTEPLDELISLYSMKYMQEVLSVEDDEDNSEIASIGNPLLCQYFTVKEWVSYCQLAAYYCEVEIDGTEEQMDTEGMKAGEADTSIELVDLTSV